VSTVAAEEAVTEQYLAALSVGDRHRAWEVVAELEAQGLSALDVMRTVIAPAQAQIGLLWATDAWSVAQEHAATAVSEAVLGRLGARIPPPAGTASPVVVTCVEQEWHALPALMVAEHLRADGLPVSYLGANASAEHLVRHVHETVPRAVALSCSLSASLPWVRRQIEAVTSTGTPVIVGGAAFDPEGRRARALGATAYATSGLEAVRAVRQLPRAVTPAAPLTGDEALEGFALQADREELSARLVGLLDARAADPAGGSPATWQRAVRDHGPHLVGSLAASLVADDPDILAENVTWLGDVLRYREAPAGELAALMADLATAVREYPKAARLVSELRV
jgi:methanogenic corrinoid protein MtbC1